MDVCVCVCVRACVHARKSSIAFLHVGNLYVICIFGNGIHAENVLRVYYIELSL